MEEKELTFTPVEALKEIWKTTMDVGIFPKGMSKECDDGNINKLHWIKNKDGSFKRSPYATGWNDATMDLMAKIDGIIDQALTDKQIDEAEEEYYKKVEEK